MYWRGSGGGGEKGKIKSSEKKEDKGYRIHVTRGTLKELCIWPGEDLKDRIVLRGGCLVRILFELFNREQIKGKKYLFFSHVKDRSFCLLKLCVMFSSLGGI